MFLVSDDENIIFSSFMTTLQGTVSRIWSRLCDELESAKLGDSVVLQYGSYRQPVGAPAHHGGTQKS